LLSALAPGLRRGSWRPSHRGAGSERALREAGYSRCHADAGHGWGTGPRQLLHDGPRHIMDGDYHPRAVVDEALSVLAYFRIAIDSDGAEERPLASESSWVAVKWPRRSLSASQVPAYGDTNSTPCIPTCVGGKTNSTDPSAPTCEGAGTCGAPGA
jgi:hypothetical protein